jgi:pimeloyl-ACP methyl ester carboxylesterase
VATTEIVDIGGAGLEVIAEGNGEPVLLIQTALLAEELRPLCQEPALAGYRLIRFHRRGYAGSSPASRPGSITRDAADCAALLSALGIVAAHVVGLSFSGAVALQLAADRPDCVQTLALLEPPPVHTPSAAESVAASEELLADRALHGPAVALDRFLGQVIGPQWRAESELAVPGAVEQMSRDASTFFDIDLPALLAWEFTGGYATRITHPVLYVGGSDSGPWFAEVRALVRDWLPHAEDVVVEGAGHDLALTHPAEVAAAVAAFLARHPMPGG